MKLSKLRMSKVDEVAGRRRQRGQRGLPIAEAVGGRERKGVEESPFCELQPVFRVSPSDGVYVGD